MRASVYEGSRTFRTAPATRPTRAQDQALLRVLRAGICGTDLHIFQGHLDHRIPKGGIIGHETFAEVVEAPAGSGFGPGDRVVVEPIHACGECRACRMGGYYLCYKLKIYGVELPGGMQDYWTVEAVRVWGTVSIVAIHSEPTPVNLYPMFAREVTMHGSRLYNREDWEEAIRLAASGAVPLSPLVSRKIPLEGLQEGMEEALRGGPVMKVLVDLTA